jgi:hypothetical protein
MKNKTRLVFAIVACLQVTLCFAQREPQLFEPETISNGGIFGLTLSPDSKISLWVSSRGKRDTLRIMESRKVNGKWTAPAVASFSSATGEWKDIDPVFCPDGKTVLFQSNRTGNRSPERKDFDIWAVTLTDTGWGKPYHLGNAINSEASESYASMTTSGTIYFMKDNEDGIGTSDIYFSEYKNGSYQKPQNAGLPINTTERESNPFVSPAGDYIIYFSSDKNGFGEVDLYIAFKTNGRWTTPKNLGKPINSPVAEFCPFVHTKEKRLYFSRQSKQGDRFKEDTYFILFDAKKYK